MDNDIRSLIHYLLYHSFVEIRVAAYERKSLTAIYKVADVFHNVPLQLEKAVKGECDYQEILDDILKRAERNGCSDWLKGVIKQK